jgi:hypothetical protein
MLCGLPSSWGRSTGEFPFNPRVDNSYAPGLFLLHIRSPTWAYGTPSLPISLFLINSYLSEVLIYRYQHIDLEQSLFWHRVTPYRALITFDNQTQAAPSAVADVRVVPSTCYFPGWKLQAINRLTPSTYDPSNSTTTKSPSLQPRSSPS